MDFPSFQDLFNAFTGKFREQKTDIDPTVKGSWPMGYGKGISAAAYAVVLVCKQVLKQFNPLTATGNYLELWASYDNISRLEATSSSGTLRVYGITTTSIPAGTQWASETNGLLYTSLATTTIQAQDADNSSLSISALTLSSTTVTGTTLTPHGLDLNDVLTVSGATETDYNGTHKITDAPTQYTFTYEISTSPSSPASGSPFTGIKVIAIESITIVSGVATVVTYEDNDMIDDQYVQFTETGLTDLDTNLKQITVVDDSSFTVETTESDDVIDDLGGIRSVNANLSIASDNTGTDTVLDTNEAFEIEDSITNVDDVAYNFIEISGGASDETDDELRTRLLLSRQAQEGIFTNDQIELAAKLINGNTRIYIQNPDSSSTDEADAIIPGQVRVYIIRDNDPLGLIPTSNILNKTKKSIIDNGKLPAEMWSDDLFVLGPSLVEVNITMTEMLPDTATMKTALKSQFTAYFDDDIEMGTSIDDDIMRGVTVTTQDTDSGDINNSFVTSFTWEDITLSEDISYVENNGSSEPRFHYDSFSGPNLIIGDEVTITGFVTYSSYNGTHTITAVDEGYFEVDTLIFYASETTGVFAYPLSRMSKNGLPTLGTLTVNSVVV